MRRKEERSKQGQTNNKAKFNTAHPRQLLSLRKMSCTCVCLTLLLSSFLLHLSLTRMGMDIKCHILCTHCCGCAGRNARDGHQDAGTGVGGGSSAQTPPHCPLHLLLRQQIAHPQVIAHAASMSSNLLCNVLLGDLVSELGVPR